QIILDSSPDAVFILDVDNGKFIDFNENALQLLKFSKEEMLKLGVLDITPVTISEEYTKGIVKKNIGLALMGGNPVFDWTHLDHAGNEIPCEIRLIRIPPNDQQILMASVVDLRGKLKFEKEHRDNLERLKLTLESTGLACFDWSNIDRVIYWDNNIYSLLGIDENITKPGIASFLNVVHHEDVARIRLKMAGFIESKLDKEYFQDEFRIIRNDGIRFIYAYGSIIRNLENKSIRVLGTLQDWTEKKRAQSQLEYQAKLLENVSDAVFATDLKFRITSWNRAAYKLYGWKEKEVLGKSFYELLTGGRYEKSVRDFFSILMEKGEWKDTVIHKSKNGQEFYIQSSINLVFDNDGNPQGAIAINRNINEQRITEQKLKESEERLKMALDTTGLGIWDWFPQNGRIIWNEKMYEILGKPNDPAMDLNDYYFSILHPQDLQKVKDRIKKVFEENASFKNDGYEYRIIVDGQIKHIYSYSYISRNDDQDIERIIGTIQDISERKIQSEKLAYQAQILSNISDAVISTDNDFRILSWNKAAEKLYGYSEDEVIGKVFNELVNLRYIDKNREDVLIEFESKESVEYVQIHKNREGNDLYVLSHVNHLRDELNNSLGIIGVIRDISEKIEIESKLRESEEKFRMSFNMQFQYIGILSPEGHVIDINELFVKNTGVDKHELIGKKFWDLPVWVKYPETRESIFNNFQEAVQSRKRKVSEEEFKNEKNESRFVISSYTCVENEDGSIKFILAEATDITDRKIADEAVKSAQKELAKISKKFQDATKAAHVGIWEWNIDEDIVSWNPIVNIIFGIPRHRTNCTFAELISIVHFDDVDALKKNIQLTLDKGVDLNCEFRILRSGKNIHYIKAMANLSKSKEMKTISGVAWEVTQEKENEKQRLKARQLEIRNKELEQFAYVASHDLQEPLHSMTGFTELLLENDMLGNNEEAKRYLGYIQDSASRMSKLVKGLLDYSRIGRTKELFEVDCNHIVENVINDLHSLIERTKAHIVVKKLPTIKAVHTEVQMLFQNLISNAVKFHRIERLPKVELTCRKKEKFWEFSVKDNGIGIADEHKEKIFILFQRLNTRNDYDGTGIGLAHCQKIVEMLGGQLWVESKVNTGSCFYFTIPV
ncbi:MAG: PAS domain S-box protein, partial [Saprospiraceae bacterium]|nr:PAS domain S-box protein [Saprospiraceae bacterium]